MNKQSATQSKKGAYRWAKGVLWCWAILFLLADFLANDKPLVCKIEGKWMWPVAQEYAVDLGWSRWPETLLRADWKQLPYEYAWWPPVAWSPSTQDALHPSVGPFSRQQVKLWSHRHWLGTDELGRDLASGIIHAVRIDLTIGTLATLLAVLLGILIGGWAGFMGDRGWFVGRGRLLTFVAVIWPLWHITFGQYTYRLADSAATHPLLFVLQLLAISAVFIGLLTLVVWLSGRISLTWWQQPVSIPIDLVTNRLIEITVSIPVIFLIILFLSVVQGGSLLWLIAVIGLTRWTGIARLVRAEMLREKALPYLEATKAMGFSNRYSWWRHALPAAKGPVTVAAAFGTANAIMVTAFLSFIGLGMPPDVPTWGGLLNLARENTSDWWLAVFPGMALFITLLSLNIIGDHISKQQQDSGNKT